MDRSDDIEAITRVISTLVSNETNQLLMKSITLKEVQEDIFKMKEGTSLGPNGFTINFFHHF